MTQKIVGPFCLVALLLWGSCATTPKEFESRADALGRFSEGLGRLYVRTSLAWEAQTPQELLSVERQVVEAGLAVSRGHPLEGLSAVPILEAWLTRLNDEYPWTVSLDAWIGLFDVEMVEGRAYVVEALTAFTRGMEEALAEEGVTP